MAWDTNRSNPEAERPETLQVIQDPSRPMIVGLAGKAGSGKNMVGMYLAMLANLQGIPCQQAGFADALKAKAKRFGWDGLKDAPGRHFLQALGTKYRAWNVNYWLNPVKALLSQSEGLVVITDVRFPNEAQMIKDHGGETWRVHKTMGSDLLTGKAAKHASETALDGWEFDADLYAPAGDLDTLLEVTECTFEGFLRRQYGLGTDSD